MFEACNDPTLWSFAGREVTLWERERDIDAEYMHLVPPHDFWIIRGKAMSTRAVLKQSFSIKSTNLISIWGSFTHEIFHFGILLWLTMWKGARMFEACTDQILEFRRQGGWKHMSKAQFLELFDFIETMGPYWSRVHACRYPHWFPNHPQSVPLSSCGQATSTRAVLK